MSCPNANAPIDISLQNISGKCDLKCAYSFNYPVSSCNVTNRGTYISIGYDSSNNPPVTYNANLYTVKEIRVYQPSLHSFANQKSVGEILIIHISNKGGKPLLVCVPLEENNSNTKASSYLTSIVDTMSKNAPSDGESTNVSINDFTLNEIVPKKPFFSYSAIQPYQPCVGNVDIIVFGKAAGSCPITSDTLQQMKLIISANIYTTKTSANDPLLFYNSTGPGSANLIDDEIFIDCKPVNSSSEETTITKETNTSSSSSSSTTTENITQNPAFIFIITFLAIIVAIYIVKLIYYGIQRAFDNIAKKQK